MFLFLGFFTSCDTSNGVINGSSVKYLLKMCLVMIFSLKISLAFLLQMIDNRCNVKIQACFKGFLWNGHGENKNPKI